MRWNVCWIHWESNTVCIFDVDRMQSSLLKSLRQTTISSLFLSENCLCISIPDAPDRLDLITIVANFHFHFERRMCRRRRRRIFPPRSVMNGILAPAQIARASIVSEYTEFALGLRARSLCCITHYHHHHRRHNSHSASSQSWCQRLVPRATSIWLRREHSEQAAETAVEPSAVAR